LSGSGLPWSPARGLRFGERTSFDLTHIMFNHQDG